LATWDFYLDYGVFSSFNVAFFAHPVVSAIAKEMERPTRNRILASTWIANILCGICVYLIPAFGYLAVEPLDDGENIYHSLDPTAIEVIIGELAVIVNLLCSNLLFTFYGAKTAVAQILPVAEYRIVPAGVAGIASCACSICVNFMGDFGVDLFYGIGAVAFSIIGFVLPPLYYFAQYQFKSIRWGLVSIVVFLIGGGMMVISLIVTIQDVI
jgi:amino acid permease